MTITTSVPNFIIFSCSVDRAAIDSHSGGRIIIIKGKTYNYNRGYSPFGAWPLIIIKLTDTIGAIAPSVLSP
ncbi:hypothetical protein, partial [Escherichia coli]|uniref:hypothetical protein n=1 Tax=Escherichia coli TaxID=562 RepID=UPI003F4517F2